ncbi:MAG: hypothetical protein C4527_17115 [Candidatus Omnitrophota bacterium]|jgi:hypothetical protein|nr:MAG: hypothetical protein C4527_17115 [Candidatus Omnitrophota bacterium]
MFSIFKRSIVYLTAVICISAISADPVTIEKVQFGGWNNCYCLTNGTVELIVTADIGPRIIHFGFVGEESPFYLDHASLGLKGDARFRLYGGHRFWIAPEGPKTSYPDNFALATKMEENTITLTAPPEVLDSNLRRTITDGDEIEAKMSDPQFRAVLGMKKEMVIRMKEDGQVTVIHKAANAGTQPVRMAPWALTVFAANGFAILPNPPFAPHDGDHLLPARSIITWSYTDLADPRLSMQPKYITVQQDPSIKKPLKLGIANTENWAAYVRKNNLFVKYMNYQPNTEYPDMGSSTEIYTGGSILELETLAPITILYPRETAIHEETWRLFKIDPIKPIDEYIEQVVLPIAKTNWPK